jgi:hypothetical protein
MRSMKSATYFLEPVNDAIGDGALGLGIVQQMGELADTFVEQLLVAPAARQALENGAAGLRQVDAPDHRVHRAPDDVLHRRILDEVEHEGGGAHQVRSHQFGVGGLGQPVGQQLHRVVPADQLEDRLGVEEFFAHEQRQVVGDLVLVAGDDGGVARDDRNRDAPEQRHHREPVGQRADHRGFGKRAQQARPPGLRQQQADHEQHGCADEEAEGDQFGLAQFVVLLHAGRPGCGDAAMLADFARA